MDKYDKRDIIDQIIELAKKKSDFINAIEWGKIEFSVQNGRVVLGKIEISVKTKL